MGVMSYDEMMSKCVLLTMSQAWQLGRAVLRARATHTNVVQAVVEMQHGLILIVGKVCGLAKLLLSFLTMDLSFASSSHCRINNQCLPCYLPLV